MRQRPAALAHGPRHIGACTYNEYHNTYTTLTKPDAGTTVSRAGSGGTSAGGSVGVGGTGGSAGGTSAGGSAGVGGGDPGSTGCTGCVSLEMPATPARALGLAFDADQDLSDTLVSWRMRVRESDATLTITFSAESGNDDQERFHLSSFQLTAASGWQTFGADFSALAAGGTFDGGIPFDKSEVERIAFGISTNQAPGVLTPVLLELDFIRFSDRPALDRDFAADAGDLELITAVGEPSAGATLRHAPD